MTLVPERPEEVTTEGGLDLVLYGRRIVDVTQRLAEAGIAVSLFVDPDPRQIQALLSLAGNGVAGFEINTEAYTRAADPAAPGGGAAADHRGGGAGRVAGSAHAGHGLTHRQRRSDRAIPGMEELNIGHFIIARAVIVGIDAAVREMLAAMAG